MGKRKKRRTSGQTSTPKNSKSPDRDALAHNPLAQGLKNYKKRQVQQERAQIDAAQQRAKERLALAKRAEAEERTMIAAQQYLQGQDVEMSDEELFSAALDDLDPIAIDRGKYGGNGPVVEHVSPAREAPLDPYEKAEAAFLAEFGNESIERMEQKYHTREPSMLDIEKMYRFRQEPMPKDTREEEVEAVRTKGAGSMSLDQSKLLREAAKHRPLAEIHLRGLSRDVATQRLDRALEGAQKRKVRYLRVITGKGLQSAAEPVLKPAFVEWCMAKSFVYAPEIQTDGTCGSFVVRIATRRKSR